MARTTHRFREPLKNAGGAALARRIWAQRHATKKRRLQPVNEYFGRGAEPKFDAARGSKVIFQRFLTSAPSVFTPLRLVSLLRPMITSKGLSPGRLVATKACLNALLLTALLGSVAGCGQKGGQQTQLQQPAPTPPNASEPRVPPSVAPTPTNPGPNPIPNPNPISPNPVITDPVIPTPDIPASPGQQPSVPSQPNPSEPISPTPNNPASPTSPDTSSPIVAPPDASNPVGPTPLEPAPGNPPTGSIPSPETPPTGEPQPPVVEEPAPKAPLVIEGPHQAERLQAALDSLAPGDTLIIRAGQGVYRSGARAAGQTPGGFTLTRSGTAEKPIRIVGEGLGALPRPVIDQGQHYDPNLPASSGAPMLGLYLPCVSHVRVENLEIRNTQDAGISTALGGCRSENLHFINNHIHQVYGSGAVAGIRVWGAQDLVIEGNTLSAITNIAPDVPYPPRAAAGSAYKTQAIRIARNSISNTQTGVQLIAYNTSELTNIQISANQFRALQSAVQAHSIGEGQVWPEAIINKVSISDNLFHALEHGAWVDLSASNSQSAHWSLQGNTINQCSKSALVFSGVEQVSFLNNLVYDSPSEVLVNLAPLNATLTASISQWDHNLYWHPSEQSRFAPHWIFNLGGAKVSQWDTLASWQTAISVGQPQLSNTPDVNALLLDPRFVNAALGDFSPQHTQVLKGGQGGAPIGAFSPGRRPGPP